MKHYCRELNVDAPEIEFVKTKGRHLGSCQRLKGWVVTYNPDGSVKDKVRVNPKIYITERFDQLFKEDPEKADRLLRFTVAHEVGHLKHWYWGPSHTAEEYANEEAEKLTGIKREEHVINAFEMIPSKEGGKRRGSP